MAQKLVWSVEAVEDLESIAEYVGRDSAFYSRAIVAKIIEVSVTITEQPLAGRVVQEINDPQIRERFVYSYRLVYKIYSNYISIIAIIHGKRLLEKAMDRFE